MYNKIQNSALKPGREKIVCPFIFLIYYNVRMKKNLLGKLTSGLQVGIGKQK